MTFSVVALDPVTGQLGVAVQSCHPAVGAVVPLLRDGVGAVVTQARGELRLGTMVLDRMAVGRSPHEALQDVLVLDDRRDERQLAVVSHDGACAGWTGSCCVPFANHIIGDGFVVAANLAATGAVAGSMAEVMRQERPTLVDGLVAALAAGEAAGGDLRGLLSAALVVGTPVRRQTALTGAFSARIDASETPLADLRRAAGELRAHQIVATAAAGACSVDVPALVSLVQDLTEDPQTLFWFALDVLAGRLQDVDAAARLLAAVVEIDSRWATVLERMPSAVAAEVRSRLTP